MVEFLICLVKPNLCQVWLQECQWILWWVECIHRCKLCLLSQQLLILNFKYKGYQIEVICPSYLKFQECHKRLECHIICIPKNTQPLIRSIWEIMKWEWGGKIKECHIKLLQWFKYLSQSLILFLTKKRKIKKKLTKKKKKSYLIKFNNFQKVSQIYLSSLLFPWLNSSKRRNMIGRILLKSLIIPNILLNILKKVLLNIENMRLNKLRSNLQNMKILLSLNILKKLVLIGIQ